MFPSVDAAAIDALQFASELSPRPRLERGGAIRRVAGGFTYDAPLRGTAENVSIRLGPGDVAWYHTHSRSASGLVNRLNEGPSPLDRDMVDRVDPLHRPLYILTPSGRIVVYRDGRVARLERPATALASSDSTAGAGS